MSRSPYIAGLLLLAILVFCLIAGGFTARSEDHGPAPTGPAEHTFAAEGETYQIVAGKVYRAASDGKREYVDTIYEPGYREKNYRVQEGAVFRVVDGKSYRMKKAFHEDFEGVTKLTELIGEQRGWTSFTLQSPRAPNVKDYVALKSRILKSGGAFLDNRVEPATARVHGGRGALKCVAVAKSNDMVCTKASLDTEMLHFVRGDHVYYRAWYFIEGSARPFTLMDLESSWLKGYPGIRIRIDEAGHLDAEVKWLDKPVYRQPEGKETAFPVQRWVRVDAHFTLSEKNDGVVELWQDGKQIVSCKGRTLPLNDVIYNNLEVGISAHAYGNETATLYVDDVSISEQPIPDPPRP
ncbi:MAG: heparin lyase I family protein [Planctomycetes bacterium]|nr:heparin lyase I family protein [Planctomycetota bacterium]